MRCRASTGTTDERQARYVLKQREAESLVGHAARDAARRLAPADLGRLMLRLGRPSAQLPAGDPPYLVYAWITATFHARYVGLSRVGLKRPRDRAHVREVGVEATDTLYAWTFATPEEAAAAEAHLINALRPARNRAVAPVTSLPIPLDSVIPTA